MASGYLCSFSAHSSLNLLLDTCTNLFNVDADDVDCLLERVICLSIDVIEDELQNIPLPHPCLHNLVHLTLHPRPVLLFTGTIGWYYSSEDMTATAITTSVVLGFPILSQRIAQGI